MNTKQVYGLKNIAILYTFTNASTMKQLEVLYLENVTYNTSLNEVSDLMDLLDKQPIANTPWPEYNYKPKAEFSIAYGKNCILLKFFVTEKAIRAVNVKTNDNVYEDTCVEFFIAFGKEKNYYNLEFNCIGTCLAGFGEGKESRTLLSEGIIKKIKANPQLQHPGTQKSKDIYWDLTLIIPLDVFCFHQQLDLKEETARVNFYKCGDLLPDPHFLAWSNIKSDLPNFHLPEFFGKCVFI